MIEKTIPTFTVTIAGYKQLIPYGDALPRTSPYQNFFTAIDCRYVKDYFTPNKEWTFDNHLDYGRKTLYYRFNDPLQARKTDIGFVDYYGKPECWDQSAVIDRWGRSYTKHTLKSGNSIEWIKSECIGVDPSHQLPFGQYIFKKIGVCVPKPYKDKPIGPIPMDPDSPFNDPANPGIDDPDRIVGTVTCPSCGWFYFRESERDLSPKEKCAARCDGNNKALNPSDIGNRNAIRIRTTAGRTEYRGIPYPNNPNYTCPVVVQNNKLFLACTDYNVVIGRKQTRYIPVGLSPPSNIRGSLKRASYNLPNTQLPQNELLSLRPQISINKTNNILTWKLPKLYSAL